MNLSQQKWVELHAEGDHEHVDWMLASLIDTAEFLKSVVLMMEIAQVRLDADARNRRSPA